MPDRPLCLEGENSGIRYLLQKQMKHLWGSLFPDDGCSGFFLFLQNGGLSSDYCDFARFQNTLFRGSNMTFLFRAKGITGDNVGAAHRGRPNPAIVIRKTSRRAGSRSFRSSLEILGKWSWTDFRFHGAMVVKRWSSLCEQACSLPHHFTTTPTGSKSAHDENCFA